MKVTRLARKSKAALEAFEVQDVSHVSYTSDIQDDIQYTSATSHQIAIMLTLC